MTTQNNFFADNKRYRTKDPYKVVLLMCLGAKVVERNIDDPNNIVFTLEHEKIADFVNQIHSGELQDLMRYTEYHKQIMGFIRDVRMNRTKKGSRNE